MKIIFSPFANDANRYIDNLKTAIKALGHEIIKCNRLIFAPSDVDAVFLQWYEGVSVKSRLKSILILLYKLAELNILRIRNIKIITVYNNRKPHDVRGINSFVSNTILKHLLRIADKVLVMTDYAKPCLSEYLSKEEMQKVFVFPHPNYIVNNSTDNNPVQKERNKNDNHFVISYTGLIRPYKNIELILSAAEQLKDLPITFIVCGMAYDKKYADNISTIISKMSNVRFKEGYMTDEELSNVIKSSDIQIFPFDKESAVHSGSIIQAFSNARTVICPNIPAIRDFSEEYYYGYDYRNRNEHEEILKKQIIRAYLDWKEHSDQFYSKGQALFKIVQRDNSIEKVTEAFAGILGNLRRN